MTDKKVSWVLSIRAPSQRIAARSRTLRSPDIPWPLVLEERRSLTPSPPTLCRRLAEREP